MPAQRAHHPAGRWVLVAVAVLGAAGTGCAANRLASRAGAELAVHSIAVYRDEPDYELARVSGYANVKLLEALLRSDPEDQALRLQLAEAFAGVAFAFAEDDLMAACCADPGGPEPPGSAGAPGDERAACGGAADIAAARARVRALYDRGAAYARRALAARRPRVAAALDGSAFALRAALGPATRENAAALFWYAFNALGAAGAAEDAAAGAPALGRIRVIAERLVELDATLEHGGPWLLLGVIDASLPAHLSVTADRGAAAFAQARRIAGDAFLLGDVEWARTYAVATGDRRGFETALDRVLAAPQDVVPGERLMTTVAKRRARYLRRRADALFVAAAR